MKKFFKIVFVLVLLFLNITPCRADNVSVTKYFLENGDYIEIELIQDEVGFLRSSRTTSGRKKFHIKMIKPFCGQYQLRVDLHLMAIVQHASALI